MGIKSWVSGKLKTYKTQKAQANLIAKTRHDKAMEVYYQARESAALREAKRLGSTYYKRQTAKVSPKEYIKKALTSWGSKGNKKTGKVWGIKDIL